MNAERGISVQEGPKYHSTVASTVVRAAGDGGYWVSTIRLAGYPTKRYETLVFPFPTEVELVQDAEGKPEFEGDLVLRETSDIPVTHHNLTNMRRVDFALRNHQRAIVQAIEALSTQGQ